MNKKRVLLFLINASILSAVIFSVNYVRELNREESLYRESRSLMDSFQNRFEYFVNSLISKGVISSEYFSQEIMSNQNYDEVAASITQNNSEILGLNLLDINGKIIKVFPLLENQKSLGKVTQNINQLRTSVQNDEEFWLSPPFPLYQGPQGFAIYIPIRKNHTLIGWIAPVVSIDSFFRRLIKDEYLQKYHLSIRDDLTGEYYFKTRDLPGSSFKHIQQTETVRGRKMTFISWPRTPITKFGHWPWNIALALSLSLLITYIYILMEVKGKTHLQIDEVESLLRFSIQDASSSAILIQNQLDLIQRGAAHISLDRVSQHAGYISSILDQAKVLQRISNMEETTKLSTVGLLSTLTEVIDHFHEKLQAKGMKIDYHPHQFEKVTVEANRWLLTHGVLSNIFFHVIQNAMSESIIDISYSEENAVHYITIKNKQNVTDTPSEKKTIDRVLSSARRVLQLFHGDLLLENNLHGHFVYIIMLPATKGSLA